MAPLQRPVIEAELQSAQIISAPLAAAAKVAPEPTVEILYQGTGWDRLFSQFGDGFTDIVEPTTQLLAQDSFLLPAQGIAVVAGEHRRHPTQQLGRALEFSPKQAQVLIELLRKSQELSLPRTRCTDESQVPSIVMTASRRVRLGARRGRSGYRLLCMVMDAR